MTTFASFEGFGEFVIVAAFLFLTWAASTVLALIALTLAFRARTRRVSRRCAIVGIVASIPVGLFDASLPFRSIGPGDPVAGWPFLFFTLAPLIVATAVFCFDQHFLSKVRRVTHDA